MGEPMKKPTKQPHLSKNERFKQGSNQPPLSRAKKARKRFMAGEKSHENTKTDVTEEILSIALQYIGDNSAYQKFCKRTFFKNLAKKPGRQLDLSDVANTISQYVCKATVLRRKKEAYKISRVVDCCIQEKIEPWAFKDFIAGHGSFPKSYKYAVAKYPRSAEKCGADSSDSVIETGQNADPQASVEPSADDDNVLGHDEAPTQPAQDEKQTSNRKKPEWPKSERSVNIQATTEGDFATLMAVGVEEDVWVRLRRRAFDEDYVDLCIKEVLPEYAVIKKKDS